MSIHASKAMIRHCLALAILAVLAGQVVGQTMQHEAEVKSAQFGLTAGLVFTASKDYRAAVGRGHSECDLIWRLASCLRFFCVFFSTNPSLVPVFFQEMLFAMSTVCSCWLWFLLPYHAQDHTLERFRSKSGGERRGKGERNFYVRAIRGTRGTLVHNTLILSALTFSFLGDEIKS